MVLLRISHFDRIEVDDPVAYIYSHMIDNQHLLLLQLEKFVDIKNHMLRLAKILEGPHRDVYSLFSFIAKKFPKYPDPEVFDILVKKAKSSINNTYDEKMIEMGAKIRNIKRSY